VNGPYSGQISSNTASAGHGNITVIDNKFCEQDSMNWAYSLASDVGPSKTLDRANLTSDHGLT